MATDSFLTSPGPMGWHDRPEEVAKVLASLPMPFFGAAAPELAGAGAGKVSLLFPVVRQAYGKDLVRTQSRGTCTSQGWSGLVDYLKAWQIVKAQISGAPFPYGDAQALAPTSHEVIYAGERIQVGKGQLGNGDGGVGAWCAKFVTDFGTLQQGVYGDIDLTVPSDEKACAWATRRGGGVPAALLPLAAEHIVKTTSQVNTYEEVRDLHASGKTTAVCSNVGFTMARDADGFCVRSGRWGHCMLLIASDDTFKRPGCLCQNSWGDYLKGPTRWDQPAGSFWIDADTVNRMLAEGDSFTASDVVGYEPAPVNFMMV
jgi:hypothetical protein